MKAVRFAFALALLSPCAGRADELSELAGLLNEPVVSTASKSAETAGLAPATTSVISGEDLRRFGFRSLGEAIDFLGLGLLTERSFATPEIGARGVLLTGDYGNHVLLLLDGHALNEPWDGTAYYDETAAIPLDLVDHVEVILGPGSVLYGSSAMLGVINVITRRAKDYQGLHLVADAGWPREGHVAAGYGTRLGGSEGKGELLAGVDLVALRGPDATYGLQRGEGLVWGGEATHREITVPSAYLRLGLGDVKLALRAASSRRQAAQILGSFDDPTNYERDRWLSADLRWSSALTSRLGVGVRLYGDLYDYFMNAPSASAGECLEGQERCTYQNSGVSRWAGGELSGTWDWAGDGRFVTLVGGELRRAGAKSWVGYEDAALGGTTRVSGYDAHETVIGAYLQQTARPASWLLLNAGARLDHSSTSTSHLSPRVAAVVPAWRGGAVKLIYAEAFRAPTFYERLYEDATTELRAETLRPETVRSLELAVEQRLGAHRLRLGLFRSWWKDLVVTADATPEQVAAAQASGALAPGVESAYILENASEVNSYGLQADWDASALGQRLRYGAALTLARTRQGPGEGERLAAAAQAFGNVHVAYDLGGRRPTVALAGRFVGPRPVALSSLDPLPEADAYLELQAAVSGPIAGGLSYRIASTFTSTGHTAYSAGPLGAPEPGSGRPELLPRPRLQALAGLRYDL